MNKTILSLMFCVMCLNTEGKGAAEVKKVYTAEEKKAIRQKRLERIAKSRAKRKRDALKKRIAERQEELKKIQAEVNKTGSAEAKQEVAEDIRDFDSLKAAFEAQSKELAKVKAELKSSETLKKVYLDAAIVARDKVAKLTAELKENSNSLQVAYENADKGIKGAKDELNIARSAYLLSQTKLDKAKQDLADSNAKVNKLKGKTKTAGNMIEGLKNEKAQLQQNLAAAQNNAANVGVMQGAANTVGNAAGALGKIFAFVNLGTDDE